MVLSIVGADLLAPISAYMRGKIAQETPPNVGCPVDRGARSTQFHELAAAITESLIAGEDVEFRSRRSKRNASSELAQILTSVAIATPLNTIHEVAGPEQMSFADMARTVLHHQHPDVRVVDDPTVGYSDFPSNRPPSSPRKTHSTARPPWLTG